MRLGQPKPGKFERIAKRAAPHMDRTGSPVKHQSLPRFVQTQKGFDPTRPGLCCGLRDSKSSHWNPKDLTSFLNQRQRQNNQLTPVFGCARVIIAATINLVNVRVGQESSRHRRLPCTLPQTDDR